MTTTTTTMLLPIVAILASATNAVQVGWSSTTSSPYGAGGYATRYGPTCDQVQAAYADIKKLILSTTALDEDKNYYYRLIPGFVRLSFHMCTGKKCKGCVNVNDTNNVHLDIIINALEPLYKRHASYLRRGDFWALAGIAALKASEEVTNTRLHRNYTFMQRRLGFRYGRQDCSPASPFTNEVHDFPDAQKGTAHVLRFFADNFNFSADDAVIILGAHKLGGLRNHTTHAIVRQWTDGADILTNSYYVSLRNASSRWTQTLTKQCPTCQPLWHFVHGATGKRLMLNVDMSLLKSMSFTNGVSGAAACTFQTCPFSSSTLKFVNEYADSDEDWQQDFSRVFMRMIETGYREGELKTPYGCPTVTVPPPETE